MNIDELTNCCEARDFKFKKQWIEICYKGECEKRIWIELLRTKGVVAAYPYDGWVDKKNNELCPIESNSYYDDGTQVGDIIALGDPEKYRLVEIIDKRISILKFSKGCKGDKNEINI